MIKINDEAIQSDDAASLRRATASVIKQLVSERPATKKMANDAAEAVLAVVRTGYARDPRSGTIDADDLAEAAIARIRASRIKC